MAHTFHHFGVPTQAKSINETFIEGAGVHVTDPDAHPFRVEFLRFEPGSGMPDAIKQNAHAAFVVNSIDEAIEGHKVIVPPFDATDELRVAFIQDGDAVIEVMEMKR